MRTVILFLSCLHVCVGIVGQWNVFSTKTAYAWATDPHDPNPNDGNHQVVNNTLCKAIHLNMVVRHGSRYPSSSATRKIAALYQKLLPFSTGTANPELKSWTNLYREELASELAPEGEVELKGIGRRTGIRFQGLFDTNGKYTKFASSSKSRAKDSSQNFHYGLTNAIQGIGPYQNEVDNSLARFYDGCTNYETQVDDNETHFRELTKFEKTPEFINIRKSLKSKLALNFSLSADEVYLIYELCSYDKYIAGIESFWCSLLTDDERRVLEFGQDIEKFYEGSYGHPINTEMTCPLVSDIFHTMDRAINDSWNYDYITQEAVDSGYLAGKFLFGHSETVVPLMTALGLYKDSKPLLASNRVEMANRQFKTSEISPFAANVALVLYACDQLSTMVTDAERTFMVQLFVNEKIVKIPGCEKEMCFYEQVRRSYNRLIDRCNITEVCTPVVDDTTGGSPTTVIDSVLIIFAILISHVRD